MATEIQSPPGPKAPPSSEVVALAPSPAVRWWVVPLLGLGVLLLLALGAAGVFAWRWRMDNLAALARVKKEVARIEAAGEPITTEGLYAHHRVPKGTPDATALWLAALNSFNEQAMNADGKDLPIVGAIDAGLLAPGGDPALVAASEAFLQKYDPTREAILAAVRHGGQCRIPVQFENGIAMLLPNAQKMRSLARLLALDIRVRIAKGDAAGAVESLDALYGAHVALTDQLTLVEQLVQMAIQGVAFAETENLLAQFDLTDEQLARIDARLAALDIQGSLTTGLMGERAMGYHTFHHLHDMPELSAMPGLAPEGQLSRPADCEWYLQLFDDLIAASREPFPEARKRATAVEQRLKAKIGSQNPLEKLKYVCTALLLPATGAAFDASARTLGGREALRVAIAAERYRLKTGAFPVQASDLVPAYLPSIPADPFDGLPIRMKASPAELIVYSIGRDGKDDGGMESRPSEPDIVVRVPAAKNPPASAPSVP
jgi:hypothetical protein